MPLPPPRHGPLNILFYSEPHPFRNSYTEHLHVARTLLPVLLNSVKSGDLLLRMLSNNEVVDRLALDLPDCIGLLQRPTNDETHAIDALFGQWGDAAIAQWLDLVRGQGAVTDVYAGILERLHAEQPIDAIITWSENGAVRRFAQAHDVPVLFSELGPTRAPFPQTMYFDPAGTNGHAALRGQMRALIEAAPDLDSAFLPGAIWLVPNERANEHQQTERSLIDRGVTLDTGYRDQLPDRPYLYVPLQLADDLNTLLHSDFASPLDFLRHVTGLARDNGYALVVKGHPGVKERPYNMRREIEALDWLEDNAPDTVVLARDCSHALSHYAMANAAYTVSINSSVGFESMLLGVPALTLGQAVYDADGWLQEQIPLRPSDAPRDFRTAIDALVSVHMDHVLVPSELATETDYLARRLRALVQGADLPPETNRFSDWHVLQKSPLALPRSSVLGRWRIEPGSEIRFETGQAVFTNPAQTEEQALDMADCCMGYIDMLETGENGKFIVSGWVLDHRRMTQPATILLVIGGKLISRHRITVRREDVLAAFPALTDSVACGFRFSFQSKEIGDVQLIFQTFDGYGQLVPQVLGGVEIGRAPSSSAPDAGPGAEPVLEQEPQA